MRYSDIAGVGPGRERQMTIYRGYDIKPNADGTFGVHSGGSYAVVTETFPTEEAAMNAIDAIVRASRAAAIDGQF